MNGFKWFALVMIAALVCGTIATSVQVLKPEHVTRHYIIKRCESDTLEITRAEFDKITARAGKR